MASSSQPTKKSHKRKSDAANLATSNSNISVVVEEASTSAGPAFVNFPSVRPSKNTPFTIYTRDVGSSSDLTKQHTIIAGETEDVEYFSTNRDHNLNTEGSDCQYLPAIYDPSTSTIHINPSTPLYLLTHGVKRLRASVNLPDRSAEAAKAHWKVQRNDLGETFGTRKAKSQIKAEERNKVDVDAMQGVKGHLMGSIPELLLKEGPVEASELIPVPNLTTSDPTEVYPRDSLISPAEWSSIDITSMVKAQEEKDRKLPMNRGWLHSRIRYILNIEDKNVRKSQLRYVYYLSTLLLLLKKAPILGKTSSAEIPKLFPDIPRQLLDGVIIRFSEIQGKKHIITEKMKTKLLAWICVLYLTLSNSFSIETNIPAKDLGLSETKIQTMFKSLGCSVNVPTPEEREKQGITLAEAKRKAVLKAPVTFPQVKRGGPVRR
ncbi:uncharacterized protein L201_000195 [Kwoniella dendrophila CBS 6074]|uniref:DNA-directed RNA polymerase I subunit RPA49 n=1 Tax=Kwoniella dendrophila CBS 6074 TaxID=1295534 RepID=A0AAX4JKK6_9TREE